MNGYPIPAEYVAFARSESDLLVPATRSAGFADRRARGDGDFLDHLGTLMLFRILVEHGVVVERNVTAGRGDTCDLRVWDYTVNVKASSYMPYRCGLNLFVKAEELTKPIDVYVQVFIHLDEPDTVPHMHVAGFAWRHRVIGRPTIVIPNTGGHRGVAVPCAELRNIARIWNQ